MGIVRTSGVAESDNNDKKINEPAKKGKSWLRKMATFVENNKLNFVFLSVLAFALYNWITPELCLSAGCGLITIRNGFYLVITVLYIWFVIKTLKWIKADEKLDEDLKRLTMRNLQKDNTLKDLTIAKLKNKNKKK